MVERPKSARQARRPWFMRTFSYGHYIFHHRADGLIEWPLTPFRSPCTTWSLCIYVKPSAASTSWVDAEPLRHRDDTTTHEVYAISILVSLDEFIDRPVLHPVRNHRIPFSTKRNADQRKDIGMLKVSPDHCLFAESLSCTSVITSKNQE